jgi:hypothetical protein
MVRVTQRHFARGFQRDFCKNCPFPLILFSETLRYKNQFCYSKFERIYRSTPTIHHVKKPIKRLWVSAENTCVKAELCNAVFAELTGAIALWQ